MSVWRNVRVWFHHNLAFNFVVLVIMPVSKNAACIKRIVEKLF